MTVSILENYVVIFTIFINVSRIYLTNVILRKIKLLSKKKDKIVYNNKGCIKYYYPIQP